MEIFEGIAHHADGRSPHSPVVEPTPLIPIPAGPDPFANTADPAAYVPRTATEGVLVRLEMALREGVRVICLHGPAGAGKTLLLRVLEERIEDDFESIRVPFPTLDPDDFCEWALAELNEIDRAPDPEQALAARIARGAASGHPPLVWLVDDADSMQSETLLLLLRLQKRAGDAMRIVFVRASDRPLVELEMAHTVGIDIWLEGAMRSAEMVHYVRARLDHAGADPRQRAQLEAELDALYACSGGNPARLHAAAAALLCFGPDSLQRLPRSEDLHADEAEPTIELPPSEIAPEEIGLIELIEEVPELREEDPEEIGLSPGSEPELDLELELDVARALGLEFESEPEPEPVPVQEAQPEANAEVASAPQAPQNEPARPKRRRVRLRRLGRR
jgi:type II secretory pathway predicted ATPase ExeA